jgi:hypothetical protein
MNIEKKEKIKMVKKLNVHQLIYPFMSPYEMCSYKFILPLFMM